MSDITPFNFDNQSVRVVLRDGEPLFVAKDVAEALGYSWNGTTMIKHVPEEWRGVTSVLTPSGAQEMAVLTEQGLYFFLGRSDKQKALPMQKWLAGEVLPSIRKTGSYSITQPQLKPTVVFADYFSVAALLGLDKNAAAIAANNATVKLTNTNVLALLGQTHLLAERQDTQWFTPTDLGQRTGISGRAFNMLLAEAGFQTRNGDVWEVTAAGRVFSRLYDTGKKRSSGAPVLQVKWSPTVIQSLKLDDKQDLPA